LEARVQELESQLQSHNTDTSETGSQKDLQSGPNICIATPITQPTSDNNEESEELRILNDKSSSGVQLVAEEVRGEEEEADAGSATGSSDDPASYTLSASDDGGMRFFGLSFSCG
jgi:hypothetical protein